MQLMPAAPGLERRPVLVCKGPAWVGVWKCACEWRGRQPLLPVPCLCEDMYFWGQVKAARKDTAGAREKPGGSSAASPPRWPGGLLSQWRIFIPQRQEPHVSLSAPVHSSALLWVNARPPPLPM